MYECRIHEGEFWETLPDDAVELGTKRRGQYKLYRFGGEIHDLRLIVRAKENLMRGRRTAHTRWHKTPRPECPFCNPPAESEQTEAHQGKEV